jgi:oligoribonuclease NrnB/cAMP/cGMP phosphodiesterase (DHH superfamily)
MIKFPEDAPMFANVHHISHDDLDGISCLLLSQYFFTDLNVTTKGVRIDDVDKEVRSFVEDGWTKDTFLIITDVSVSREVADLIQSKYEEGYRVALVDHHKTALWLDEGYTWALVATHSNGVKTSATSMFLEEFFVEVPNQVAHYCELVRLYDTWDWSVDETENGPKAKSLNDLFFMVSKEAFSSFVLDAFKDESKLEGTFNFGDRENTLLEVENKRIEAYIKTKDKQHRIVNLIMADTLYKVGVVTNESYHSELGNALCNKYPEIEFAMLFDVGKKRVSLRTMNPNLDVSAIAKFYSGGGHMAAAGFTLTNETISEFLLPILMLE